MLLSVTNIIDQCTVWIRDLNILKYVKVFCVCVFVCWGHFESGIGNSPHSSEPTYLFYNLILGTYWINMYLAVGDPLFLMMFKVLSFMLKYYLFDELSFSKSIYMIVRF